TLAQNCAQSVLRIDRDGVFVAPFLFFTQELNGNDLRISNPSLYRTLGKRDATVWRPHQASCQDSHRLPASPKPDKILTRYYSGGRQWRYRSRARAKSPSRKGSGKP